MTDHPGELWYRSGDLLPQIECRVRVYWDGSIFEAARILRKGHRRTGVAWMTVNDNRMIILEPDKWGDAPELWQPLYPDLWQTPLPKPVRLEHAKPRPFVLLNTLPRDQREWWRTAGEVRYSPVGSVTPKEAEGRIMRALWAESTWKRADTIITHTPLSWLARMVELVEMIEGKRPTYWHARHQPTARDLSDCSVVLPWLGALSFEEECFTTMHFRAPDPPYTYAEIADRIGRKSEETARTRYKAGIMLVTKAANNVATVGAARVAKRLADLKERNRQCKLSTVGA